MHKDLFDLMANATIEIAQEKQITISLSFCTSGLLVKFTKVRGFTKYPINSECSFFIDKNEKNKAQVMIDAINEFSK